MPRLPTVFLWLSGLLLLLWLHVESQHMLLPFMMVLVVLLLPVAALTYLLAYRSSTATLRSVHYWGGFFLTLAVAFIPAALLLQNWQDQLTHTRATQLISSLNSYRRAHGTFPDSLAQLAPTHLPAVPTTAYGAYLMEYPFYYTPIPSTDSTKTAFALSYSLGMMVETSYNSTHKTWQTYD